MTRNVMNERDRKTVLPLLGHKRAEFLMKMEFCDFSATSNLPSLHMDSKLWACSCVACYTNGSSMLCDFESRMDCFPMEFRSAIAFMIADDLVLGKLSQQTHN